MGGDRTVQESVFPGESGNQQLSAPAIHVRDVSLIDLDLQLT